MTPGSEAEDDFRAMIEVNGKIVIASNYTRKTLFYGH